jgi:SAM-dependent methyltransferase
MGRRWAAEYHDLFAGEDDVRFYSAVSRKAGPSALDIGVGTGRLAIPIARAGSSVVGIDSSMELLNIAHGKVTSAGGGITARMRLLYGDIRDFSLPREGKFDLAYAASGGYNRCRTRAEMAHALACVRDHLRVGGILAFDLLNVSERLMDGMPRLDGVAPTEDGGEVVRHIAWRKGPKRGDVESHSTYERFDGRGRSVERLAERDMLHLFEPTEIAEVLQLGGFEDVDRFSDLKGGRSAGSKDGMAVYICYRGP